MCGFESHHRHSIVLAKLAIAAHKEERTTIMVVTVGGSNPSNNAFLMPFGETAIM